MSCLWLFKQNFIANRSQIFRITQSIPKEKNDRLTVFRVTLLVGAITISFHPAGYSIHFLYSTHLLIYSPNRLSLKKTTHPTTIYTFHSSSSSFPPNTNSSIPQLLNSRIPSFIDWTCRLCGVRFCLLKLPDVFSGAPFFVFFLTGAETCWLTSWVEHMTSSPLTVVKAFNSPRISLYCRGGWSPPDHIHPHTHNVSAKSRRGWDEGASGIHQTTVGEPKIYTPRGQRMTFLQSQ